MVKTDISSDAVIKEAVDNYKAVIAAAHRLLGYINKPETHNLARLLVGIDNGSNQRYNALPFKKKIEFYKALGTCVRNSKYSEGFKALDVLSGGKMSLLTDSFTGSNCAAVVTAIKAVQSPEKPAISKDQEDNLIVYHGTAYHDTPFELFKEGKPIWFTSDLEYAKGYAESRTGMMDKRAFENFDYFEDDDFKYTRDDAKDMLKVNMDLRIAKLDLKNPAVIGDPHNYLYAREIPKWLKGLSERISIPYGELENIKMPDYIGDWHKKIGQIDTLAFIHNPNLVRILEKHGYDGIVSSENTFSPDKSENCFAVFHNSQIKEITPNDQEWSLVDNEAKQLKAAYMKSWVEEGHREEVFDAVEEIFKERSSISPEERLKGGFLDKFFEGMGFKLIDNVRNQAVKALHDRITNRKARVFTQDQRAVLTQYRDLNFLAPRGDVFYELRKEVLGDPDVTRCPEKWSRDAFEELDGLADSINISQSKGLHL